jgi:hypothetical protein
MITIEDLLPYYPAQDDPNIQKIISSKEEFVSLESTGKEEIPKQGEYLPHQTLIMRFMQHYDKQFIIHDPGTGKTCTLGATAEWFRNNRDKSNIRRTIVVVKGQTLEKEFRRQLVCSCTPEGEYTKTVSNTRKMSAKKANVTRELNKWYTVTTYGKLASNIIADCPSENNIPYLLKKYSDTLFFLDEIQYIRTKINIEGNWFEQRKELEEKRNKSKEKSVSYLPGDRNRESTLNKKQIYLEIFWLLHYIERSKVILSSATPVVNSFSEIGTILNLLLPLNKQMKGIKYNSLTLKELEPYIRGMVSYVRASDTGIDIVYMGTKYNFSFVVNREDINANITLSVSKMRGIQKRTYIKSFGPGKESINDVRSKEREASIFVFPNGSYGIKGFSKYVTKNKNTYILNDDILPYLESTSTLRQLSCILADTIEEIRNSEHVSFLYVPFVNGSGSIIIGLCIERILGYKKFKSISSIFKEYGEDTYCPIKGVKREIKSSYHTDTPHYALLDGSVEGPAFDTMIEVLTSDENVYGKLIKVFITSPVGKDGINVNNVDQIHMIGSEWNESGNFQAINRGVRINSHEAIIRKREKKGIEDRFPVKIYNHIAMTKTKGEDISVGLDMYYHSLEKDIEIKKGMRMVKKCTIDCNIHHNRNIRETDKNYSAQCDYSKCNYKCFSEPNPNINYTTYDLLYSQDDIKVVVSNLEKYFKDTLDSTITLSRIYSINEDIRRNIILFALDDIIINRHIIYDPRGYKCYLRNIGNIFFLSSEYPYDPIHGLCDTSYYGSVSIYTHKEPLSTINDQMVSLEPIDDIISKAKKAFRKDKLSPHLYKLELYAKAIVLENAMLDEDKKYRKEVGNYFYWYLYRIREPIEEIEKYMNKRKRGGNKLPQRMRRFNPDEELIQNKDNPYIRFHTIYTAIRTQTAHAAISTFTNPTGRYRVLMDGEWKDISDTDTVVYNMFAQKIINRRIDAYKNSSLVFGSIIQDSKFRIHDMRGDTNISDPRQFNRGKICGSWRIPELADIMLYLDIDINLDEYGMRTREARNIVRENKLDISEYDKEELKYIATVILMIKKEKYPVCDILEEYFMDNNLMIDTFPK